jgi:glycosyltransferase involved in cell wall biosynthesis
MRINLVLGFQSVVPPTQGGGVENLIMGLSREFARAGHQVTIISRQVGNLPAIETDALGIHHHRVRGWNFTSSRTANILNAFLHGVRLFWVIPPADVTSFHTPFAFLHSWRRRIGVTTFTIHRTPKWVVPFYRRMDRVYAGSDSVVSDARKIDPKISNLKRIYNGLALPELPIPRQDAAGSSLTFLYVGRFVPDKGLRSLIQGFELSLQSNPTNRLMTVGPQTAEDGADEVFFQKMSRYIQDHSLVEAVTLQGPIYDRVRLNQTILDADVICVPTLTGETFSMAILEAMALGKPILTSDFGPMPEAVEHGVTGYVAHADDAKSISEAIQFFSESKDRLSDMGRQARKTVEQYFTVDKIAKEYLEDFACLIERGSSTNPATR